MLCLFATPAAFAVDKKLAGTAAAKPQAGAAAVPTDRFDRPVPMGVSIGNTPSGPLYIYAGTAGLLVQDVTDSTIKYILSNNHVLGAQGPNLCPGTATPGIWTLQPGTLDIGTDPGNDPNYQVGTYAKNVPFTRFPANKVDAALATTTTAWAKSEIFNLGEPTLGIAVPAPGMAVVKSGRTTGVTNGTIDSINAAVRVSYGTGCGKFRFKGQVIVTPGTFSGSGDSGSAILESATMKPVALLFAGSSTQVIGNDIGNVFSALGVTMSGASPSVARQMVAGRRLPADPEVTRLSGILDRNEDSLVERDGIEGVGISRDSSGWFFKVYVSRPDAQAPEFLEGVRVRLANTDGFVAR
jgi:hypothetical protein